MGQSRWIELLRIGLGALFVSVFFENLSKDLYTVDGYSGLIRDYAERNNAPGFWSNGVMEFVADSASVAAPLQAVFELSLGIALVLGIARGAAALAALLHLTALWISELGIFWVWELLMPMLVAFALAATHLPALLDRRRPLAERVLGPPTWTTLPTMRRLGLAVLGGAALALAIVGAKTGGSAHYEEVAVESGVTFALLLVALAFLDERRAALAMQPQAEVAAS